MNGFTDFVVWCFAPANFVYTLFLLVMFLYWVSVILGALDLSFGTPELDAGLELDAGIDLDADLDVDMDVEVDADLDVDVDADVAHGSPDFDVAPDPTLEKDIGAPKTAGWVGLLRFFNIGEVPLMVFLSFFFPLAWALSMAATHTFGVSGWLAGMALATPVLLAAAFAAKFLTWPMKKLFRALNREASLVNPLALEGRACVVTSLTADAAHGQAEIATRGVPLTLNIVTRKDAPLAKGARAVVVERVDEERDIYLVEGMD